MKTLWAQFMNWLKSLSWSSLLWIVVLFLATGCVAWQMVKRTPLALDVATSSVSISVNVEKLAGVGTSFDGGLRPKLARLRRIKGIHLTPCIVPTGPLSCTLIPADESSEVVASGLDDAIVEPFVDANAVDTTAPGVVTHACRVTVAHSNGSIDLSAPTCRQRLHFLPPTAPGGDRRHLLLVGGWRARESGVQLQERAYPLTNEQAVEIEVQLSSYISLVRSPDDSGILLRDLPIIRADLLGVNATPLPPLLQACSADGRTVSLSGDTTLTSLTAVAGERLRLSADTKRIEVGGKACRDATTDWLKAFIFFWGSLFGGTFSSINAIVGLLSRRPAPASPRKQLWGRARKSTRSFRRPSPSSPTKQGGPP